MEEVSAVLLLQNILNEALERRCSDVHLHSFRDELVVEFREQGQLTPFLQLQGQGQSVLRRVKALARMDVADSRFPQDGSFTWQSETMRCDIRAASLPTVSGEALVLRLFPEQREPLTFTKLGMTHEQAARVDQLLHHTTGLMLVAGPTGSGKTTTLYAMMLQLARWGRRIVSIEDPVEIPLPECQQMEVRERIGITFELGLKALLRQDPDAIMIGEIRDEQTARTALRAALTGHLVLSTTHARDIVTAAARLADFGVSRSLVGDVLRAVVVQELLAVTCNSCQGNGCKACDHTGYGRDRQALFSIYEMNDQFRSLFSSELSWADLRLKMNHFHPNAWGETM